MKTAQNVHDVYECTSTWS